MENREEEEFERLRKDVRAEVHNVNVKLLAIELEHGYTKQRVDNLHNEKKKLTESVFDEIKNIRNTIFGDGNGRIGMVTKLDRVKDLPSQVETLESEMNVIKNNLAKYAGALIVLAFVAQIVATIIIKIFFK